MPMVDTATFNILKEMFDCQDQWRLSDKEFGEAVLGGVGDAAKIVRGWKSGADGRGPSVTAQLSFQRLKALVAIANNSPLDAEENFSIACAALPDCLL